jgi:hypothetical protein
VNVAVVALDLFCELIPDVPHWGVFSCRFRAAVKPFCLGGGSSCPHTVVTEHITANLGRDENVNFETVR